MRIVAVTLGDPAGVGPELVAQALSLPRLRRLARWILIGDPATLAKMPRGRDLDHLRVGRPWRGRPGRMSPSSGEAAWQALMAGIDLCLTRGAGALMTAPLSKRALHAAGYPVPGQTEVLDRRTGCPATMMLAGGGLRISLVTVHVPLRRVPDLVTRNQVMATILRTAAGLRRWFGIRRPRIAVLGLNPHAGEGGLMGNEEALAIAPAVEAARKLRVDARGPLAADGAFGRWREDRIDAYVAMYHDQGLTALKAVAFSTGVNLTLGLPFLRTSPDHGTAFALAGKGKADPGPTMAALRMAAQGAGKTQIL